jgi:ABC-2 type transport system ATP-binding protein
MDKPNEILNVQNITKIYGKHKALDNVSLSITKGQIYGLIGENGAGKSTFMRVIMGMIRIDNGVIELFGDNKNIQAKRKRMGQSIEFPALYPQFSAADNLKIQAMNAGIKNPAILETLEIVHLGNTGEKAAKNFSLGMRQRLAIAQTLITNPEFLILDEPTNGLDPVGMIEMREIIKSLSQERNITILLSSHLLDELSKVATHFGILHKGILLCQLSKQELYAQYKGSIILETNDNDKAISILQKSGIAINKISALEPKLEDFYMERIGND